MTKENNNTEVRNDVVTKAFLDLREGKSTSKQELIVFEACKKKVNILVSNYRSAIDREEFLGNLFIRVLEKKDVFDPSKSSFETWLGWQCMAIRKDLYTRYSTATKKNAYSLDEVSMTDNKEFIREIEDRTAVSPEKKVLFNECMEAVEKLTEELSINQRGAIEAIYDKNLSPGEAADLLGRKKADFYRDHSRALISLRKKLEDCGYSSDDVKEML